MKNPLTKNSSLISGFSWLLVARATNLFIGFFTMALVTRHLGPENYGVVSYSVGLLCLFELLYQIINQDVFKKSVIDSEESSEYITTFFFFRLVLSVFVFVLVNGFIYGFHTSAKSIELFVSVISVSTFLKVGETFLYFLSANALNRQIAFVELTTNLIFNLLRVVLCLLGMGLIYFAFAFLVQKLISFLMSIYYFSRVRKIELFKYKVNFDYGLKVIKESFPLLLSSAAGVIFIKVDQILIAHLINIKAVGLYSFAVKLTESWFFISILTTQVFFPRLVKIYRKDILKFEKDIIRIFGLLFFVSILIILFTNSFAEEIVLIITNESYVASIPILKIQIWSLVFFLWLNVVNVYEVITKNTYFTLQKMVFSAIINLLLNYILIPSYGVVGASFSTIISYAFAASFGNILWKKTRKILVFQFSIFNFKKFKEYFLDF